MSMRMVCNRCNKVKEDEERFSHVNFAYLNNNNLRECSEYDLCPECAKQFSMFMDGGTVEEDHYKDSKPSAVVIHKLCDGNYIVENKHDKGEVHHCGTCAWQYSSVMCPRMEGIMHGATISCSNEAVACEKWTAVTDTSIRKEAEPAEPRNTPDFVDHVIDAVSDDPDDPCPCYAKHCIHIATCCGCKEYDEWKERHKK